MLYLCCREIENIKQLPVFAFVIVMLDSVSMDVPKVLQKVIDPCEGPPCNTEGRSC